MEPFDANQKIFITGAAGFIGYHLAKRLLSLGARVAGLDNLNAYYDVQLKKDRLAQLRLYPAFSFTEGDLADAAAVNKIFEDFHPDIVVNLAAQAGVRYSIDHPRSYIDSNIIGFFNVLEACRHHPVEHLLFASSSSVYGNQEEDALCHDGSRGPSHQPVRRHEEIRRTDGLYLQPPVRDSRPRACGFSRCTARMAVRTWLISSLQNLIMQGTSPSPGLQPRGYAAGLYVRRRYRHRACVNMLCNPPKAQ
jgi:nucleoside-diphosphate-sugar epimerase